jgi:hypothetical protein
MDIFSIFGKGNKNKYYNYLLNFYRGFSSKYHLQYREYNGVFQVMARYGPHPCPGIKVHTPLSDKIYNVLTDQKFQEMIIHGEIDGIKIYESHDPKQVTFYISFHSIHGYKKLLSIFRAHEIDVNPNLQVHRDASGSYVLLNRMYISKDIFVRYSTDFYGKKKDPPQADDSKWRSAEDHGHPQILAVSRSYLLNNLYNLNYKDNSHIITFLSLKNLNGIIVPIPNIILSLSSNKLITYNIYKSEITEYDLHTDVNAISDHPEERLRAFLE